MFQHRPLGLWQVALLVNAFARQWEQGMRAEAFVNHRVAAKARRQGIAMQRCDVVALHKGFQQELPVGGKVPKHFLVKMKIGKPKFAHAAVHPKGIALGIYGLLALGAHQQHASGFQAGHFYQVELSAFHAGLQLGKATHVIGVAYQGAAVVIGPCVVGAAKAVLVPAAVLQKMALGIQRETDQARAPVAADVQKRFDASPGGARQKNGRTGQIAGEPVPGGRQVWREAGQQGHLPAKQRT